MNAVLAYLPALLEGLTITLWMSVLTIACAAIGGLILGAFRSSQVPIVRTASLIFIEGVRGPSGLVWMFWAYYALPLIPGMPELRPFTVAVVVLGVAGAAYAAEIVRAGVESIHAGQRDACHALGLSNIQSYLKVILPQALSQIVPAFAALSRGMIKWTAVASFVGVHDLLYVVGYVRTQTFQSTLVFCIAAAGYLLLSVICALIFRFVEMLLPLNRVKRAVDRSEPLGTFNLDIEGAR